MLMFMLVLMLMSQCKPALKQKVLKVLRCFSRTKTLDEYHLPPLNGLKQLNRELNVVSVFARILVREDSDNLFFMIEVTESSTL